MSIVSRPAGYLFDSTSGHLMSVAGLHFYITREDEKLYIFSEIVLFLGFLNQNRR